MYHCTIAEYIKSQLSTGQEVKPGRGGRRIIDEKRLGYINIHRSIESVLYGVVWQIGAISVFPADEVCTGMKFVPVPEKSTKKEG